MRDAMETGRMTPLENKDAQKHAISQEQLRSALDYIDSLSLSGTNCFATMSDGEIKQERVTRGLSSGDRGSCVTLVSPFFGDN